jgi:hypothetical protein
VMERKTTILTERVRESSIGKRSESERGNEREREEVRVRVRRKWETERGELE